MRIRPLLIAALLIACAPLAVRGQEAARLRAGAATSNVTPPLGAALVGNWTPSEATHVHDELYARCLVLDNGEGRLALVVVDSLGVPRHVLDHAKRLAQEHTGIPADRILISATHSHSAPTAQGALWSPARYEVGPALDTYQSFLAVRIADGIRRAVTNLQPARIGWGRTPLPDEVFNRRWLMKPGPHLRNPFGGLDQAVMNPGVKHPALVEPAGPTDPEIAFLSVTTDDGRPLALLANYSLHYVGGVPSGDVSADYFGVFANSLARLLGEDRRDSRFVAMMSNGTSGDINNIDVTRDQPRLPPYARMERVANRVAAAVYQGLQHLEYRDWVPLGMAQRTLALETRRPTAEQLAWAREVMGRPAEAPAQHPRERIYAERMLQRADVPPQVDVVLQAVRIGDLALTTFPFEVFVEIGLELKAKSPFAQTFTISLANGSEGYLPTARHHDLGGYETWLGTNRVEKDAARTMTEALLSMLHALGNDVAPGRPPSAPSIR